MDITSIETNMFDTEEIHENCTVQIWQNSNTGETSIGWWKNLEWIDVQTYQPPEHETVICINKNNDENQLIGCVRHNGIDYICESETASIFPITHWKFKSRGPKDE